MEVHSTAVLERTESRGYRDNRSHGSDTRLEENIYRLVYACGRSYDFVAANDMDAIEEVAGKLRTSTPLCPMDFIARNGSEVIRLSDRRTIFPITH